MIPLWPLWGVSEGFVGELVGVMQKVKQQEVEGPCESGPLPRTAWVLGCTSQREIFSLSVALAGL